MKSSTFDLGVILVWNLGENSSKLPGYPVETKFSYSYPDNMVMLFLSKDRNVSWIVVDFSPISSFGQNSYVSQPAPFKRCARRIKSTSNSIAIVQEKG